jgi:hypothetical protein
MKCSSFLQKSSPLSQGKSNAAFFIGGLSAVRIDGNSNHREPC